MMSPWAIQEFQTIELRDKRLHRRAVIIASLLGRLAEATTDAVETRESMSADSESTAQLDALYRFIRNPKVTPKNLIKICF